MKIALTTLFAAIVVAATPAHAAIVTYQTTLSSFGEANATSPATGNATVTFDDVLLTINVTLNWSGLILGTGIPFGHIHCCTVDPLIGNAGAPLNFGILPNAATSTFTDTYSPGNIIFATLFAGAAEGRAYVNIHTPGNYPGGQIRGFLVPEPSSLALTLAALGLVGVSLRRKTTA